MTEINVKAQGALDLIVPRLGETVPAGADPGAWSAERCVAHRYHAPEPRYLEEHHVLPRAWQAAWQPPAVPSGDLWAPTTVLLCRTGHGNVHYWISRFMHEYDGSVERAVSRAILDQHGVGRQEHVIARRALDEFRDAGGDLAFLTYHGIWGGLYGGAG